MKGNNENNNDESIISRATITMNYYKPRRVALCSRVRHMSFNFRKTHVTFPLLTIFSSNFSCTFVKAYFMISSFENDFFFFFNSSWECV